MAAANGGEGEKRCGADAILPSAAKRVKLEMESHFESYPYGSLLEHMRAWSLWKLAELEGVAKAVDVMESKMSWCLGPGAAEMLQIYEDALRRAQEYDAEAMKKEEKKKAEL